MQEKRTFFTKRNIGIGIGVIVVLAALNIVIDGAVHSPGPTPTTASTPTIDFAKMEAAVNGLTETGLIQRVDVEMNEVYVDGFNWATLNIQEKENVARAVAYYIGHKKNKNLYYVDVMDWNSGKKLADFSASWGFKVEE